MRSRVFYLVALAVCAVLGTGCSSAGDDLPPMLASDVGRNSLPGTLLIALALLCVGCLVALLLPLRRRVTGNRA